jgi:hypothetical protein
VVVGRLVILVGGLLAGGYMFRVLTGALVEAAEPLVPCAPVPRSRELIALTLALCSVLLGLLPLKAFDLLQRSPACIGGQCRVARGDRHAISATEQFRKFPMNGPSQLLLLLVAALAVPVAMLFTCVLPDFRQRIFSLLWVAPIPALAASLLGVLSSCYGIGPLVG